MKTIKDLLKEQRKICADTYTEERGFLAYSQIATKILNAPEPPQVSVEPVVKVNFANIIKDILEEGANIANYGNPFETEETVIAEQEKLYDEAIKKYADILSKISA